MKNSSQLLIAMLFMMGFLFFWQALVVPRYTPKEAPATASAPLVERNSNDAVLHQAINDAVTLPSPVPGPAPDQTVTLTSDNIEVTLMSRGARVASWKIHERNQWLQMVMPEEVRQTRFPLETFADASFAVKQKSDAEALFTATLASGLLVEKRLQLLAEPPFHRLDITLTNPTASPLTVHEEIGWEGGLDKHVADAPYVSRDENGVIAENFATGYAQRIKRWHPGVIMGRTIDITDNSAYQWVGVSNLHFLAAFLDVSNSIPAVRVVGDRKNPVSIFIPIKATLAPGAALTRSFQLYVGPKDYRALKELGHNLEASVDFGFFGVIAKILLRILHFFESLTGNYGWAIVLLTLSIQLVVFPLTRKSLVHAARMKRLQPQIKQMQEQHKSDPKRMQIEMMNFYRKNGMKFMGMEGCIPMLLQLPIFLALYSTLHNSYELRGAPWIFWIHDLGAKDPYRVLPIIMGIGMFLQQKMSSVAMDPAQAKIMLLMPIMFTFMFMGLPAGLVLYWSVNSLATIAIQFYLMRQMERSENG